MNESSLLYNYYRTYNPQQRRYLESDPIGLQGGLDTYAYANGSPVQLTDPTGQLSFGEKAIELALKRAAFVEAIGGGPEDPIADAAAAIALATTLVLADPDPSKADRDAYHAVCDAPPPPGLDPCDLIRWKIQRAQRCISMRQHYITKWNDIYPGHPAQIAQRQRELVKLQQELKG